MVDIDMDSRMTLKVINDQQKELKKTLAKVTKKYNYISNTTADKLSNYQNEFFNEITDIQEKCRETYTNINNSKQQLTNCKKQVIEINKVLLESKKKLNQKKNNTLQGITRTSILNNEEIFRPQIDDRPEDTEEEKKGKDRIGTVLKQIGNDESGDDTEFYEDDENEDSDSDSDPLYGTHNFPRRGGSMIKIGKIYNKSKTKKNSKSNKRKTNKRKSNKRKTSSKRYKKTNKKY
jgi:hypothetical protein